MPKKKKRSPLSKLTRAWTKASPAERQQFLACLANADPDGTHRQDHAQKFVPIATGRYLTSETVRKIESELQELNLDISQLSSELGLAESDDSLHRAMSDAYPLRLMVVDALQAWLTENKR